MGNIHPSSHPSPLSHINASMIFSCPQTRYDIFINHRGKDTKHSIASLIYDKLHEKGYRVFFDKMSIEVGDSIVQSIVYAIRTSSVHIVILSPQYANSEWCLDELNLITTSGARIIPVFWGVRPSEVRMENNNGVYARAFKVHKRARKFNSRVLNKWKKALRMVSVLEGIIYQGNDEELLGKIERCVSKYAEMAISNPIIPDRE